MANHSCIGRKCPSADKEKAVEVKERVDQDAYKAILSILYNLLSYVS